MKELERSGLFCVPVPEHTINIRIYNEDDKPYIRWIDDIINIVDLPKGKWELIGSVTAEHIDFDPASFVETVTIRTEVLTRAARYLESKAFRNYLEVDQYKHHFYSANSSLRSLLTANDVHFVNPYGDEPIEQDHVNYDDPNNICLFQDEMAHFNFLHDRWQQAESKLVEKILILKPL